MRRNFQFTRDMAKRLARTGTDDLVSRGEPTDAEITAKLTELNNLRDRDEIKAQRRQAEIPDIFDIQDQLEDVQDALSKDYVFYTLSSDEIAYGGQNTTVPFNTLGANSGTDALQNLGLTLNNGVFTSTKAKNLLMVSFQVLFDQDSGQTGLGIRSATIVVGNKFYGRNESSASTRAVFVSGSSLIVLNRNDTFFIRTFQTDRNNIDILSSNTVLTISAI